MTLAKPRPAANSDRDASKRPSAWLHRYAVLVACATWLLIIAGGMVTSTGSGLAVPDWPTTYGHNMFTYPVSGWVGGIFYEHGHRLIASAVGMLTIGLCVWLWIRHRGRLLTWLGVIALAAVILQGLLGGLTVLFFLPTPISVLHACLAQTFFCLVVSIAVFTSPTWHRRAGSFALSGRWQTPHLAALLAVAVFGQLLLGAIMRHTDSGLAVTDFPLAYGQVLPDLGPAAIEDYNHHRRFELLLPAVTRGQIMAHMAHRLGAILVTAATAVVVIAVLRRHGRVAALRRPALILMVLVAAQIALGGWTVWSQKAAVVATAHVAVGAAALATAWVLTLRAYQYVGVARAVVAPGATLARSPA